MDEIEIFLRLAFMGVGLLLTGLTLASWIRTREAKLMLATAGFGMLAAQGVLLVSGIVSEDMEAMNTTLTLVALGFLAVLFIYLSALKR